MRSAQDQTREIKCEIANLKSEISYFAGVRAARSSFQTRSAGHYTDLPAPLLRATSRASPARPARTATPAPALAATRLPDVKLCRSRRPFGSSTP